MVCLLFACAILFLAPQQVALAQTGTSPIPLPSPFTPIVDLANVIDPDTEQKLGSIYLNLKQRGQIEFAVVTIDTTGGQDISDYALAIYRGWGVGTKENDGFLLLIAVQDRKYFTEVGYHLEGDLNDGLVGEIQRKHLVPHFRNKNYGQGIYETVQSYVATLAEKRGFSIEGIDQRYAYREAPPQSPRSTSKQRGLSSSCCTMLIILGVVILVLSSMRKGGGGGRGGGGGGWWTALLLSSLLNSGSRSGGWGSSSSGWGGGGFGGGGGGGFGGGFGGGSAGGGGAGGSW